MPRLAMEANEPANTKTSGRTEGAATGVQAMQGDSCSADRVDPDLVCSTSFVDDYTGPPTPPCSGENALVDNGAAAPKLCLPPLEMCTTIGASGLLPTGETSYGNEDHLRPPNSSALPNRGDKFEDFDSTPSRTTAASGRITCLLPPPAGGSLRQNPSKIGYLIQAILKVVSVPAHFWDRGVHCFVGRFILELDEAAAFLGGSTIRDLTPYV